MAKIDLIDVYNTAFGYKGFPHIGLKQSNKVPALGSVNNIEVTKSFDEDTTGGFNQSKSQLGTPYFFPIKIDGIQLPNEPIITVKGQKTIIETPIDGSEGSFKEHFAQNDWIINIKGVCILDEDSDEYPEEQVRAIRKLIEKKTSLKVVCRLLSYFDINHLAIYDYDFPAIEGAPGIQPYELNCKSDKYFDLELLEGNS